MEKEILEKLSKRYCKKEKFILLLYKICKANKVDNAIYYIEKFLKLSVSK